MKFLRYKKHAGYLAWAGHRVTGVALTLYLFAHIYVLSHLKDPAGFARLMELARSPLVKAAEVLLLVAVAAHALNGVRLTLLDMGAPTRAHKPMLYGAAALAAAAALAGAWVMFGGAI